MAFDKYKAFRNLMFNELGITKDDIRQWTKEAAFEAAERQARAMDVEGMVKDRIAEQVRAIVQPRYGQPTREVQTQIRQAVAETLAEKLTISISQ